MVLEKKLIFLFLFFLYFFLLLFFIYLFFFFYLVTAANLDFNSEILESVHASCKI